MLKAAVVTVSDRASAGEYEDTSGKIIQELLLEAYPDMEISYCVVPDEVDKIQDALKNNSGCDWIITTGGTGISPRDVTPQATEDYCETHLPGIAETLRMESYKETDKAMLSRGYAGLKGKTIIVNFPGSEKAARCCTPLIIPVMAHAVHMLEGKGHDHGKEKS